MRAAGGTLTQISQRPTNIDGTVSPKRFEQDHERCVFRQYLPAGPTADGSRLREKALIQFYSDPGGLRTVAVTDILWPKLKKK